MKRLRNILCLITLPLLAGVACVTEGEVTGKGGFFVIESGPDTIHCNELTLKAADGETGRLCALPSNYHNIKVGDHYKAEEASCPAVGLCVEQSAGQ